jgi:O-antigen/teichoic acid export membrane protein
MSLSKIVENIFSSWANLVVTVILAFLVSPIVVTSLGKELYGIWILVTSVTGYFTVLDFGVNTAIVRYISSSAAQKDDKKSRQVYSTSMFIFGTTSLAVLLFSAVFGYFFQDIFRLYHIPRYYLYVVFMISALDLAGGLVCSVFLGTLAGLQEFKFLNGSTVLVNLVKSAVIVIMLKNGYALLTIALLQLAASAVRALSQHYYLKKKYVNIHFSKDEVNRDTVKLIYNYSIYSFIIAVALKLLFYTDSIVIGALVNVSEVVFYAIPSTLLDYLEKFVWSMVAVLVPVISANEAAGANLSNVRLYITGTRYTLLVSLPIMISLYLYGSDFIRLWMGPEFGARSLWVLRLLLLGFGFSFSQLIAHGILKGISRHKVLAYILALEALGNLIISVALARPYGIEGIAFGTMIPLIAASVAIIIYTCNLLNIGMLSYLYKAYAGPILGSVSAVAFAYTIELHSATYLDILVSSLFISVTFLVVALPISLEVDQRDYLWQRILKFSSQFSLGTHK